MNSKNEVSTVVTAQVTTFGDFFANIDFDKLNASISALANRGELSKTEKKSALEIIDQWNKNVIEKIRLEQTKIDDFVSAIQPSRNGGMSISTLIEDQLYIDELEFLIDKVGKQDAYEALQDAMDEYARAVAINKNKQSIVIDLDTTTEQEILQRKDIELESIKTNAAIRRAGNKIAKLNNEIIDAINADKDIVKAIRMLKRKSTDMRKAAVLCTDKAELAKINVTIDDANVRAALEELVNFTF